MTNEEVFLKVWSGINAQGKPGVRKEAENDYTPTYHGDNGCKCAIGLFLSEEDVVSANWFWGNSPVILKNEIDIDFMDKLRDIHDRTAVLEMTPDAKTDINPNFLRDWREMMLAFAEYNGITVPESV